MQVMQLIVYRLNVKKLVYKNNISFSSKKIAFKNASAIEKFKADKYLY